VGDVSKKEGRKKTGGQTGEVEPGPNHTKKERSAGNCPHKRDKYHLNVLKKDGREKKRGKEGKGPGFNKLLEKALKWKRGGGGGKKTVSTKRKTIIFRRREGQGGKKKLWSQQTSRGGERKPKAKLAGITRPSGEVGKGILRKRKRGKNREGRKTKEQEEGIESPLITPKTGGNEITEWLCNSQGVKKERRGTKKTEISGQVFTA